MGNYTKRLLSLALVCMLLPASAALLPAGAAGSLGSIHVLNTGWEDAIILESDGRYALIDAGEPGRGPYIVDYLQRLAGSKAVHLEFIVGTHSHVDHMGGFAYILAHPDVTVGKAYAKREANGSRYYHEFIEGCQAAGIALVLDDLDRREHSVGHLKVTLLNGAPLANGSVTNQESLCQLVEAGGRKALLAGDMVTAEKESGVYSRIGSTVDFLKVGHHGMGDSTGRDFANQLRPKVAVYTNGSSWETDSQDATRGAAKNVKGYLRLNRVGTVQYATTDIGGLLAVFGESGMEYHAIQEFPKKGEAPDYEVRGDILLRPIAVPELNFFQKAYHEGIEFFLRIYDCIKGYFA